MNGLNEVKEEIRKFLETNENGHTTVPKLMGHSKGSPESKFIVTQAYLKKRNISNK